MKIWPQFYNILDKNDTDFVSKIWGMKIGSAFIINYQQEFGIYYNMIFIS
jgi:hypothetical protein